MGDVKGTEGVVAAAVVACLVWAMGVGMPVAMVERAAGGVGVAAGSADRDLVVALEG
jgi:uncharacterized protein GlcG (DUF336 family)